MINLDITQYRKYSYQVQDDKNYNGIRIVYLTRKFWLLYFHSVLWPDGRQWLVNVGESENFLFYSEYSIFTYVIHVISVDYDVQFQLVWEFLILFGVLNCYILVTSNNGTVKQLEETNNSTKGCRLCPIVPNMRKGGFNSQICINY